MCSIKKETRNEARSGGEALSNGGAPAIILRRNARNFLKLAAEIRRAVKPDQQRDFKNTPPTFGEQHLRPLHAQNIAILRNGTAAAL